MTPPDLPERIRGLADLETLLARTTNFEERGSPRISRTVFRLERVRDLLAAVGDPQRGPRTVHVAGSKGKGTVARMLARILIAAGRSPTGLYTSPHLVQLVERVAVDGRPVSGEDLATGADVLLPHLREVHGTSRAPTFFEVLTAVAWLVFRARECADVVLETGLGGRLDATNVCHPAAVAITAIEREHAEILGDDLARIAGEKAGILKPGVPAVTAARGEALRAIEARAGEVGAPLEVLGRDVVVEGARTEPGPRTVARVRLPATGTCLDLRLPLAGAHQATNAALAAWAALRLGVDEATVVEGLAAVHLPGTLQPLGGDPLVVVDGAHTPDSAAGGREAVRACWPARRLVLLLAFLEGKDVEAIGARLLPGAAAVVVTRLPTPRSQSPARVAARLAGCATMPVETVPAPEAALERARRLAGPGGVVLATGSVRLAGFVLGRLAGPVGVCA